MATVIVQRENAKTLRKKKVELVLDGRRVAYIDNGETVRLPVADGLHRLNVAVDFYTSKKLILNATPGETYYYSLSPSRMGRYGGIPFFFIFVVGSNLLERLAPYWVVLVFYGVITLAGTALLVWRRKKGGQYFNLKEMPHSPAHTVAPTY